MARAGSADRRESNVVRPRLLQGRNLPPPIPTVPLHTRRAEPNSPYYYAPHTPRHQYPTRPEGFVPPPPPQQVQHVEYLHKVWILDCKACGTFFTNRGMKVSILFLNCVAKSCLTYPHSVSLYFSVIFTSFRRMRCQSAVQSMKQPIMQQVSVPVTASLRILLATGAVHRLDT